MNSNMKECSTLYEPPNKAQPIKVAIIGAGPGGLVSAKWALSEGLEPTIFEKASTLGGIWRDDGYTWPRMKTNSTKFRTSFLGLSYPIDPVLDAKDRSSIFPTRESVIDYFNQYAEKFNLLHYIRFGYEVIRVALNQNCFSSIDTPSQKVSTKQIWKVNVRVSKDSKDKISTNTPVEKEYEFEKVIVASGQFSVPRFPPDLEQMCCQEWSKFQGQIMHSSQYSSFFQPITGNQANLAASQIWDQNSRKSEQELLFSNKNILLIGNSISAGEIIGGLTGLENHANYIPAKRVFHLINRPSWPLARFPRDPEDSSLFWPVEFFILHRVNRDSLNEVPFPSLEDNRTFDQYLEKLSGNFVNLFDGKLKPEFNPDLCGSLFTFTDSYVGLINNPKAQNKYEPILHEKIKEIDSAQVIFDSGRIIPCEIIIFATGYSQGLEKFLDSKILQAIEYDSSERFMPEILYKSSFSPGFEGIAFIGLWKPPLIPALELQARWISRVFSGNINYPNAADPAVKEYLENRRKWRLIPGKNRPYEDHADYLGFADSLAEEIGALPDFLIMKEKDPELYEMLWRGPHCTEQYNLVGPDADPLSARTKLELINQYIKECRKLSAKSS